MNYRIALIVAVAAFSTTAGAWAIYSPTGIACSCETRTNPPERLFVAQIDLKNPKLHLRVAPGGFDPDKSGKWKTTLMEPTKIASREKFDFVVNGDFFTARGVNDAEGILSPFRAGQWAYTEGPAMTDGERWSVASNVYPCLVVHKNRAVTIESPLRASNDDWEIISGNVTLLRDGKIVSHAANTRHPRTVVGINAAGDTLTILVVDGRRPLVAVGMSYDEAAAEMLRLGCRDALNLDGGGSSVMAVRDNSGAMKVLNDPTDGRERAVANVLGVCVDKN